MDFSADLEAFISAHGLSLVRDSPKGHRTVTTRPVKRGTTLFTIRPLYGFPVRPHEDSEESTDPTLHAPTRCANCFDPLPKKRAQCSQCHSVQYCSEWCLIEHWAAYHHVDCQHISADREKKVKPAFRPYLRMLEGVNRVLEHVGNCKKANMLPTWKRVQMVAWSLLVAHQKKHPAHVLKQYSEISQIAGTDPTIGVNMLCRFGCNNFVSSDQHGRSAGHICSPVTSLLLNHSCWPNAAFVYTKAGEQQVVALQNIRIGGEIALAYVDILKPRTERQRILKDVYFFECQCPRCLDDDEGGGPLPVIDRLFDREVDRTQLPANLPTDLSVALSASAEPWATAIVSGLTSFVLRRRSSSTTLLQLCRDQVQNLPASEFSFAAYRHWLECQDECLETAGGVPWDWAYVSSVNVLAYYVCVYPPFHQMVGLQCLECAKLAWNSLMEGGKKEWDESEVRNLVLAAQEILAVYKDRERTEPSDAERQISLLLTQINSV